ncbi:MAG: hypothetical protein JWO19_904 [Bryobacterales bacterium]|jgi:hypothetical protein|nr:hypothetical protein [Bryobacterales bacterium]
MSRISYAFRAFFSILFSGALPADIAQAFGYSKAMPVKAPPPPKPQAGPSAGAVQIMGILQRESRLVDFLMEDIGSYADDQIGAAVRDVHTQARQALDRYLRLQPVIDGVEGTFTKTEGVDAAALKLIGKVPPSGTAPGGLLRHKGWKAERVDLPQTGPGSLPNDVVAPAELEIE